MSISNTALSFVFVIATAGLVFACSGADAASESEPSTTSDQALETPASGFCPPEMCLVGHHWSGSLCECLPNCVERVMCREDEHWNPETCGCQRDCPDVVLCRIGTHWNSAVCKCIP